MIGVQAFICFGSAMASLLFELILLKLVARLTGEAMLWESWTLGLYLAAHGAGLIVLARYGQGKEVGGTPPIPSALWRRLWYLEWGLSLAGPAAFACVLCLHMLYRIYAYDGGSLAYASAWEQPLHAFAAVCQLLTAGIGFLAGLEMGSLFAALRQQAVTISRFYTYYYLGALGASLVFSYAFLPFLDLASMVLLSAGLNALVAFAVAPYAKVAARRALLALAGPAALIVLGLPWLYESQRRHTYYNLESWQVRGSEVDELGPIGLAAWLRRFTDWPAVTTHRSPYQEIDLVPAADGGKGFALYLNGHYQFDEEREADYHEVMAHVPAMSYRHRPRRALVLGGGDGLLVRELLRYGEQLSHITLVELDPEVLKLGRERLRELNEGALQASKVEVVAADAFSWLRHATASFDAVYVDLPFPFQTDTQKLFSREFFLLLARRLEPQGYLAFDFPLALSSLAGTRSIDLIAATLGSAGFAHGFAFRSSIDSFIAVSLPAGPTPVMAWQDFQLPLRSLEPAWFTKAAGHWQPLPLASQEAVRIHALLRPGMVGYMDRRF